MLKCVICASQKGKRECGWKEGRVCSLCCGVNRKEEFCSDCIYYEKQNVKINIVKNNEFDINKEVDYLLKCSLNGESKIICLEELMLFSTYDGDAWIIDVDDKGAHCLMKSFERQFFSATNENDNFYISWENRYTIENESFIVYGDDGRVAIFYDYPVREILKEIKRISECKRRQKW